MDSLVERLIEKAHQISAAKRATYGLPLAACSSDTHPGALGLWCDNGLAGVGQVAVFTGEFPTKQAKGICALVNAASVMPPLLIDVADALGNQSVQITTLQSDNARLQARVEELERGNARLRAVVERAQSNTPRHYVNWHHDARQALKEQADADQ